MLQAAEYIVQRLIRDVEDGVMRRELLPRHPGRQAVVLCRESSAPVEFPLQLDGLLPEILQHVVRDVLPAVARSQQTLDDGIRRRRVAKARKDARADRVVAPPCSIAPSTPARLPSPGGTM